MVIGIDFMPVDFCAVVALPQDVTIGDVLDVSKKTT
jgi:hypothetical protein